MPHIVAEDPLRVAIGYSDGGLGISAQRDTWWHVSSGAGLRPERLAVDAELTALGQLVLDRTLPAGTCGRWRGVSPPCGAASDTTGRDLSGSPASPTSHREGSKAFCPHAPTQGVQSPYGPAPHQPPPPPRRRLPHLPPSPHRHLSPPSSRPPTAPLSPACLTTALRTARRQRRHQAAAALVTRQVGDGARGGVDGAGGEAGGPGRAGVLAGLPGGDAQAGGGHGGGGHGRRAQLLAAPGARGRDALRHRARLPPALRHRVRPPVHLHPEERALDPPRIPLHGDGCGLHGGPARQAGPPRQVHRLRLHPRRHRHHHVSPRRAQRLPLHAPLHHPRRRHDGRQRHDRHRSHHEEAQGGRQDPEEPGGDCTCSGCDAASGDTAAGEEIAGDRAVAGDRQRQDGGADRAAGRHDGAHHGRRVAAGGHPAADRRDEHAHGRLHRQQHPLHLPLLAGLLHQGLPARREGLCRLVEQNTRE